MSKDGLDPTINWQAVAVKIGQNGMDLRQPADSTSLTRLDNARFIDEKALIPRSGHDSLLVQDSSAFPALGPSVSATDDWVYGHGARVDMANPLAWENAHFPIPSKGAGMFEFGGSPVVWTGDRLLIARESGSIGSSAFWARGQANTILPYGIPAYMPLMTETIAPASGLGHHNQCLFTEKYKVFVHTMDDGDTDLIAWMVDRETNSYVSIDLITGNSTSVSQLRVVESAGIIIVLWYDTIAQAVFYAYYTGSTWVPGDVFLPDSNIVYYDIDPCSGGFEIGWVVAAPSTPAVKLGRFAGLTPQTSPHAYGKALTIAGFTNITQVAVAASPGDEVGIVITCTQGLQAKVISSLVEASWLMIDNATSSYPYGLTIASRALKNKTYNYDFIIHAGRTEFHLPGYCVISASVHRFNTATVQPAVPEFHWRARLASTAFRVGDEVFVWMRAENAHTDFLVAGVYTSQVCGFADREEALDLSNSSFYAIAQVTSDPTDSRGLTRVWDRPYDTGQTYARSGNVRVGVLDFVPALSSVAYGRSIYTSGCAVRNYDGVELGDAGFQDYPLIDKPNVTIRGSGVDPVPGTGLGFTTDGITGTPVDYYFRVYAVRYNKQGERFESAALTSGPYTVTWQPHNAQFIRLMIFTVPDTNHDDVVFEVYRTAGVGEEGGGAAFYLDGVISNSKTAVSVQYDSTRSDLSSPPVDQDLQKQKGDPHAAGVNAAATLQEFGPIGCAFLSVAGDRIWGAGGQVVSGSVQFSKLYSPGQGAGFDDIAGFQEVDTEGNPVTSVARLNDATVVFQKDKLYVITGIGPDNKGSGQFSIPQIVLADGALYNTGTALTQMGLVYWGTDGPRLLTTGGQVDNVANVIRPLGATLVPTGCHVDLVKQEVVWYTASGYGLLWNFLGGDSRWARWTQLNIAGVSKDYLVTTNGLLLTENDEASGDAGIPFEFVWCTGNIRPADALQTASKFRSVGVVGQQLTPHQLRTRVYFDGSPLWQDAWIWQPDTNTWLMPMTDILTLTPAEVDALPVTDQSGQYMTHKRLSKLTCHFIQVEFSSLRSLTRTYIPYELSLEVGVDVGIGRTTSNTFGS